MAKLCTYSSGLVGSNDLPITVNDLYALVGVGSGAVGQRGVRRRHAGPPAGDRARPGARGGVDIAPHHLPGRQRGAEDHAAEDVEDDPLRAVDDRLGQLLEPGIASVGHQVERG